MAILVGSIAYPYSMGPDGRSVAPLTAKASRDDIVRANTGRCIGLAADYRK